MDNVKCVIRGATEKKRQLLCDNWVTFAAAAKKTTTPVLFIYSFFHFVFIFVSVSFWKHLFRVRVNPFRPEDIFMYFNWYLCCGFISYLKDFFPPFDLVSAIHIYLSVLFNSQKSGLWLFFVWHPLSARPKSLTSVVLKSAWWGTKKIKIHRLKLFNLLLY